MALLLIPLDENIPAFGRQLCRYSVRAYTHYHRFTAVFEDAEAFQPGCQYVIGVLLLRGCNTMYN